MAQQFGIYIGDRVDLWGHSGIIMPGPTTQVRCQFDDSKNLPKSLTHAWPFFQASDFVVFDVPKSLEDFGVITLENTPDQGVRAIVYRHNSHNVSFSRLPEKLDLKEVAYWIYHPNPGEDGPHFWNCMARFAALIKWRHTYGKDWREGYSYANSQGPVIPLSENGLGYTAEEAAKGAKPEAEARIGRYYYDIPEQFRWSRN